jgi:hypothetical protein
MALSEGRYRALCTKITVAPNDNKNLEAACQFAVKQFRNDEGEWVDTTGFIVGHQYLTIHNGQDYNEKCLDNFQEIFGWKWRDSGDPEWLEQNVKGVDCDITLEWETYNDKRRLKVKWINPPGGGLPTSTPEQRAMAKALFAEALKKGLGISSTPSIPVSKPKMPAQTVAEATKALLAETAQEAAQDPKAAPGPAQASGGASKSRRPSSSATATAPAATASPAKKYNLDEAYEVFESWFSPGDSKQLKESEWWRILAAVYGSMTIEQILKENDGTKLVEEGQRHILPI